MVDPNDDPDPNDWPDDDPDEELPETGFCDDDARWDDDDYEDELGPSDPEHDDHKIEVALRAAFHQSADYSTLKTDILRCYRVQDWSRLFHASWEYDALRRAWAAAHPRARADGLHRTTEYRRARRAWVATDPVVDDWIAYAYQDDVESAYERWLDTEEPQ